MTRRKPCVSIAAALALMSSVAVLAIQQAFFLVNQSIIVVHYW